MKRRIGAAGDREAAIDRPGAVTVLRSVRAWGVWLVVAGGVAFDLAKELGGAHLPGAFAVLVVGLALLWVVGRLRRGTGRGSAPQPRIPDEGPPAGGGDAR